MKNFKKMLPYLLIDAVAFYLSPKLMIDTGSAMFLLLLVIPLICLFTALIYTYKNNFSWAYPILVMVLFVPSVFIDYNDSAFIYTFIFGAISLIGSFVGKLFSSYK